MRNKYAAHTDFSDINGLLGKCVPVNIDMMMERKGNFLVGEWKRPNEQISKGQEIMLKALAKRHKFIVLIISGDTDNGMVVHKFWKIEKDGSTTLKGEGVEKFKDYLTDWYLMADFD